MKVPNSLREVCLAGGSQPVALASSRDPRILTADHLRRQALSLAKTLAARPEQRWALWLKRPSEFLAAFLGLSLAGKDIVLPGNMQPAIAALLTPNFDGLITRDAFPQLPCPCLQPDITPVAGADLVPVFDRDVSITLFTSGSTGEPKAVVKSLRLFEAELGSQQQQWGELVGQRPVLSTVSHQHIYGLLHAVLWPFLRGAPFIDEVCQYPEEIAARAQFAGPVVLVSSPTHLARLPEAAVFRSSAGQYAAVFSSGGPLPGAAAGALYQLLGHGPLEILGSTETGGVAWRQQGGIAGDSWTPLPGVVVERDAATEQLAVRAAHVGTPETYVMGDKVRLRSDGTFDLQGRADRVVKVEGKRLSITDMEHRLEESKWVEAARVAVIRARREEVGAVLVLSEAGQEQLAYGGKLELNRALREHLLAYFERPVLPRRWRYVTELPYNAQGKVAMSDICTILQRS